MNEVEGDTETPLENIIKSITAASTPRQPQGVTFLENAAINKNHAWQDQGLVDS
jgi:hypothetical protein